MRVFTAVFNQPSVQALLSKLFHDAVDDALVDIRQDMARLESNTVASLGALPAVMVRDIGPLIPTVEAIQAMLLGALKNLPGGGLLSGLLGKQ